MRRFQAARPVHLVAAEDLGVRDDDPFAVFAKKTAGQRADVQVGTGVLSVCLFSRVRWERRLAGNLSHVAESVFLPNLSDPPAFAGIITEDVNGVVLAQPAMQLREKFTALCLGDLRLRSAVAERTKGLERKERKCRGGRVADGKSF